MAGKQGNTPGGSRRNAMKASPPVRLRTPLSANEKKKKKIDGGGGEGEGEGGDGAGLDGGEGGETNAAEAWTHAAAPGQKAMSGAEALGLLGAVGPKHVGTLTGLGDVVGGVGDWTASTGAGRCSGPSRACTAARRPQRAGGGFSPSTFTRPWTARGSRRAPRSG